MELQFRVYCLSVVLKPAYVDMADHLGQENMRIGPHDMPPLHRMLVGSNEIDRETAHEIQFGEKILLPFALSAPLYKSEHEIDRQVVVAAVDQQQTAEPRPMRLSR